MTYSQLEKAVDDDRASINLLHTSAFLDGTHVSEDLFRRYKHRRYAGLPPLRTVDQWLDTYQHKNGAAHSSNEDAVTDMNRQNRHNGLPKLPATQVPCGSDTRSVDGEVDSHQLNPGLHQRHESNHTVHPTVEASGEEEQIVSEEPERLLWSNYFTADADTISSQDYVSRLGSEIESWNQGAFAKDLIKLYDLSLLQDFDLQFNGYYVYRLHPLVQDWLKIRGNIEDQHEYLLAACHIVGNYVTQRFDSAKQHYDFTSEERQLVITHIASLRNALTVLRYSQNQPESYTSTRTCATRKRSFARHFHRFRYALNSVSLHIKQV